MHIFELQGIISNQDTKIIQRAQNTKAPKRQTTKPLNRLSTKPLNRQSTKPLNRQNAKPLNHQSTKIPNHQPHQTTNLIKPPKTYNFLAFFKYFFQPQTFAQTFVFINFIVLLRINSSQKFC